jgi:hypothetical protein
VLLIAVSLLPLAGLVSSPVAKASSDGDVRTANPTPQPQGGYWLITAWKVDIVFHDPWWEPHYAAWFWSPYCGSPQHYLGPGGDAATCQSSHGCISTWDWHWDEGGSGRNQLLIPKGGWLWDEGPSGPRWQGYNYQGYCWLN